MNGKLCGMPLVALLPAGAETTCSLNVVSAGSEESLEIGCFVVERVVKARGGTGWREGSGQAVLSLSAHLRSLCCSQESRLG